MEATYAAADAMAVPAEPSQNTGSKPAAEARTWGAAACMARTLVQRARTGVYLRIILEHAQNGPSRCTSDQQSEKAVNGCQRNSLTNKLEAPGALRSSRTPEAVEAVEAAEAVHLSWVFLLFV